MATSNDPSLVDLFPCLAASTYEITSPTTRDYNCVAWAPGCDDVPWDHSLVPFTFWPRRVPRDGSTESLVAVFATLGYVQCADGSLEAGFEKVAIYALANGDWTHAARQLENGRWTSKLGALEDISHDSPLNLVSDDNGQVACFVKRGRPSRSASTPTARSLHGPSPAG